MLSLSLLLPMFGARWVEETQRHYEHAGNLIERSELLRAALVDGETGQRGFVLSGREDFLSPLYQGFAEVDKLMHELHAAAENDPEMLDDLKALKPVIAEQRRYFDSVIRLRRDQGLRAASDLITQGKGKQLMDDLRARVGEMQALHEARILLLEQRREWQQQMVMVLLVVIGLLDLIVIGLLFHFTFRILKEGRAARHSLRSLSEQLSSGMQRVELRNREISLLSRMAGALHSVNRFDECYSIIGRFAGQLFPCNAGSLTLYHPSRDVLEGVAHWGDWPEELDLFEPHACWAIRRGQSHQVLDTGKDLLCPHLQGSAMVESGYVCVPLMAQGEPLGVLTLNGLQAPDLELAEAFAEQISLGVSNLSLRDSLRQQSLMDALTGLHNRRFLDETLRRELLRAARKQSSVAVVLLDVDHFKRFNDTFGHEAGDLVLRHLALEMKRNVRTSDLACRYGGEEFCLVMPEISREDAIERCESLRLSVSRLQVRYGGQPLGPINISLGLAWFPQDGEQMDALLHAADLALYQAKRGGRNRLCVYRPEMDGAEEAPG
ncbi:sensor domain-containing diguanylate cyclase [Pseudomonas subflava]|uniref:sensor domain-containing diguanylate cyclase n=1 Tax=Pseudomonas subflava TaxID=2952933 RepID=UPI002079771D|nr:diguanylate cyclase [Pseudomonas subflava]